MEESLITKFKQALYGNQLDAMQTLLSQSTVRESVNRIELKYGQPAIAAATSVEMAQLLMRHGADPVLAGRWWKPGFNVISRVQPQVGRWLVEQGAELSPHAAAGMGLTDKLQQMLDGDPDVVHALGGDGTTPLHFARDVQTAQLLVDRGAELDALDDDHESTPAQWLVADAPEVTKLLLDIGAAPDIFLAAALGDRKRCQQLIDASDGHCLSQRVGKDPFFPIGHNAKGGTILQWTLGFNSYAHQFAAAKGQADLFEFLWAASDVTTRFLVACVMAKRSEAESIRQSNPDIVAKLDEADLQLPAKYCWETNMNVEAVRLMLDMGFPIDHPETAHGYSPLHNAAWGGYAELVKLLIERGHPLDQRDPTYDSTPLGFALHCCLCDGRHPEGDYTSVIAQLIDAGSPWEPAIFPTGNAKVDAALQPRLRPLADNLNHDVNSTEHSHD